MFLIHQLERWDPEENVICWVIERKSVSFKIKYIIPNGPIFSVEKRNPAPLSHMPDYIMAIRPGRYELNSLSLPPGKMQQHSVDQASSKMLEKETGLRCKRLTSSCSFKPMLPDWAIHPFKVSIPRTIGWFLKLQGLLYKS